MLRIIGNIFSSSQAQPAVKSETEAEGEAQANEVSTQDSSDNMNNGFEAHMVGVSEDEDEDYLTTTPNAHIEEDPNEETERESKREVNGTRKEDTSTSELIAEKASARESEQQMEDILQAAAREQTYDDAMDGLPADRDIEVIVGRTASKKARSKRTGISKTKGIEAPAPKRRLVRKTQMSLQGVPDLASDGENSGNSGPRTRSVSRALESAGEESAAELVPVKVARSRKSKANTTTTTKSKRRAKSQPLPEIPEDDGDEESAAELVPVKASRTRKSITATATKPKLKTHASLEKIADDTDDEDENDEVSIPQQRKARQGTIQHAISTKQARLGSTRAARATKSASEAPESQAAGQTEELEAPVQKLRTTKRKTRQPTKPAVEEVAEEHDNDATEYRSRPESNAWARKDLSREQRLRRVVPPNAGIASSPPDRDENNTPILPSRKSLGKRPVEEPATDSRKKQRKRNNFTNTPPLEKFGFTNRSDDAEAPQIIPRPAEHLNQEHLGVTAARLLQESMLGSTPADGEEMPINSTPNGRYATPKFTPINRRVERRPQVLITSPRLPIANDSPKEDAFVPTEDNESESSSDGHLTEPDAPKSNGRRKRRLPVGDAELSDMPNPNASQSSRRSKTPGQRKSLTAAEKEAKKAQKRLPKVQHGHLSEQIYTEIAQFIASWLTQKDMTQENFNAMIQDGARTSQDFLDALCLQITGTPRVKLFNAIRRKYHNFGVRGVWTPEQDQELLAAYGQYGQDANKWKRIGKAVNRFSEDCRDRYRNYLICGDNQIKTFWTQEEEDTLTDIVEEILDNVRELKSLSIDPEEQNRKDDSLIDWNVVSLKMSRTRSRLQCMVKWKQLKERQNPDGADPAATAPIADTEWRLKEAREAARLMTPEQKLHLLCAIRDSRAARESSIPWIVIQGQTGMQGERMTLKVCFRRLKLRVLGYETLLLQDVVKILIDAYAKAAPHEPEAYKDALKNRERKPASELPRGQKHARGETGEASGSSKKRKAVLPPPQSRSSNVEGELEEEDNGEGPSNRKLVIAKGKKLGLMQNTGSTKTPKIFQRMETTIPADNGGEGEQSISARSPKLKRVAKKPIVGARKSLQRSQQVPKSAERVTASDDESEPGSAAQNMPASWPPHLKNAVQSVIDNYGGPGKLSLATPEEIAYYRLGGNFRSLEQIYADEAQISMEVDEQPESIDESAFRQRDVPQQQSQSSLAMRSDSEHAATQDAENDLTILTHDQASVDLDAGDKEDASVDHARNEPGISIDQDEDGLGEDGEHNELMVDGMHEEEVPGIHEGEVIGQNGIDNAEQRGLAPTSPTLAEPWDGYGDALQYNRGQPVNEPAPVPDNAAAESVDDSSSDVSTIYHPRFVVSSAPAPANSISDEESSEEEDNEPELVEAYGDDDVDSNYEERQPRRHTRVSAASGRHESIEL